MVRDEQLGIQLNMLKSITNSDIVAFALLETGTRKLSWHTLLGAEGSRTAKIKQSATAGVTALALRTGKPQQYSVISDDERFCFGEAILMTEQLSTIYVWPVMYHDFSYRGVIIAGRRKSLVYSNEQLEQGEELVKRIENIFNASPILI